MFSFNIDDFKELYCNQLSNKEEIIKKLNISEYIYKTIIKEFSLKREKTNKINRFKANNKIEVVKIQEKEPPKACETKEDKNDADENKINHSLHQDIKDEIKKKLDASRRNRNKNITNK